MKLGSVAALFSRCRANESGATAIEYSLIAALISIAIIAGTTAIGGQVLAYFNSVRW